MKNYNLVIDSLVKLFAIALLIIAVATSQEYSYYTFLRWTVMIISVYFIYKSYNNKQIGLVIFYIATALLFNPFKKVWFQRDTWQMIDILIAIIFLVTLIFDWKKNEK